jgi:signal transduction histidine kinase
MRDMMESELLRLTSELKPQDFLDITKQVAHDIRSPLTALMIVSKHFQTNKNGYTELLNSSIERILNIADDLLKLNENGTIPIGHSVDNDGDWLKKLINEKLIEFSHKNIAVKIRGSTEGIPVHQINDLKRIVSNLVNNSVEANAKMIELNFSSARNGGNNTLQIIDNGRGMTFQHLNSVQKGRFTSKAFGNGLGLSNLRNWLKKQNGSLKIRSIENLGTEITICF